MDKVYIISGLLSFLSFPLIAQNSDYQAQYREKGLGIQPRLESSGIQRGHETGNDQIGPCGFQTETLGGR
mgnify:FL=1